MCLKKKWGHLSGKINGNLQKTWFFSHVLQLYVAAFIREAAKNDDVVKTYIIAKRRKNLNFLLKVVS